MATATPTDRWKHQDEAFDFLSDKPAAMLSMEMGCGKTRVALDLLAARDCARVLVLCPKSVIAVWPKEAAKHHPERWDVLPLGKGSTTRRAEALEQAVWDGHQFKKPVMAVLNYEAVLRDPMKSLLTRCKWDGLVLDESHRVKGPEGKASLVCQAIANSVAARGGTRLALTGTPMPHDPLDIYAQYRALDPSIFGPSYRLFQTEYATHTDGVKTTHAVPAWERAGHTSAAEGARAPGVPRATAYKWLKIAEAEKKVGVPLRSWVTGQIFGGRSVADCAGHLGVNAGVLVSWMRELGLRSYRQLDGFRNLDELHKRMYRIAFRVRADDVLDLPPTTDSTRTCELSADAARVYRQMDKELRAQVNQGEITAANGLARLMRLQQITSGYLPIDGEPTVVDSSKQELLKEVLEDMGLGEDRAAVVFCRFHNDIDATHDVCTELGLRCTELSGRQNELLAFQTDPTVTVIAVQVQAGGLGIDLSRARYGIYYSLDWSLGNYEQSRARIHRPGQENHVTYVHLVASGTVDEVVLDALERKADVVNAVVDDMRG